MTLEFCFLAERPEFKALVAHWYFNEWGALTPGATVNSFEDKLAGYLQKDAIPLALLAMQANKPVGVAHLRFHEMTIYPDKTHWLGGVYVAPHARGEQVASALVQRIEQLAQSFGVRELHLQTEQQDGGLYQRLGWLAQEQVNYRGVDVVVMSKLLS
ncbi:GNAT family N-acetyltransferase [Pseudoalteromonas ardens]|uniref:GNAT family N-acetyltransferase n=1 Tax=Pseudoalteromonas ardens TaxID=3048490 RepID=UPI0018CE037E|nr:GNAT family N-acetyltransferase [Pseudoalteromonas sp. R96]MDK1310571.1 GNAT family N-acetyltransferase [Pseudoalteromonas sp. R96]